MDGVHPLGMLGLNGGVRAIGSAPAAGGSSGLPLSVTPGGWGRYERLDFGGAGASLAAVHARVSGAGYGNFDIILDHVSRVSQLHPNPHAPCAMLYIVPMLVVC